MPEQAEQAEVATRISLSITPSALKRIDIAASIETRGNRSEFMIAAALEVANAVLERDGIRVTP